MIINNENGGANANTQRLGEMADRVTQGVDAAAKQTQNFANQVKRDYKAELSTTMNTPSKFGFKMYMYAILLFCFFVVRNSTCIVLLTGWVILVEKNRDLARLYISTIALYALMDVFFDSSNDILNVVEHILKSVHLKMVAEVLNNIESWILRIKDLIYAFVGFTGMMKAKNGGYYRIGFIENMFVK
jgi:hypothetical protein